MVIMLAINNMCGPSGCLFFGQSPMVSKVQSKQTYIQIPLSPKAVLAHYSSCQKQARAGSIIEASASSGCGTNGEII